MEKIVEVVNLNYEKIFKKLYLDALENNLLMVTGKSGCGKTTLANIIVGNIVTPDNVLIDSELVDYYDKKNLVLASIEEKKHKKVSSILKEKGKTILKEFGKTNIMEKYLDELSSGEYSIVSLITDLAKKPKILVIDDMLYMVDKYTKFKILKYLNKITKENKTTIIYFTSDIEDLVYADDIAIIKDGKIDMCATKEEIFKDEKIFTQVNQTLPFLADLSTKLKYYNLVDKVYLDETKLVNKLWK